jgi:hypothetical protein
MGLERETSYVEAQEAARMLGVNNKRAVRNLVTRGQLESKRDGETAARLLISVVSLEKLR